MRQIIGCLGIFLANLANAGESKPPPPEHPPWVVLAYTKDGSGNIRGTCIDAGRDGISCDFVEVYFMPPSNEEAEKSERDMLALFKNDPKEAQREVAQSRGAFTAAKSETPKKPIGPKLEREFANVREALGSDDPSRMAHALVEHERHTCKLISQSWTSKFHRIGTRKWLSDAEPIGACRVVQVMELSSDDPSCLFGK
jgi:hypothetical protein